MIVTLKPAAVFIVAAALVAVGLGGCAAERGNEVDALYRADVAACRAAFLHGVGNYGDLSRCLDRALDRRFTGSRDADLVAAFEARRRLIAEQIDRKALMPDEGELRISQAWSEEQTEAAIRQQAAASAGASISALNAAPIVSATAASRRNRLTLTTPPPASVMCGTVGQSTNCNGD